MPFLSVVFSEKYLLYDFGVDHPLRPKRSQPFLKKLRESGLPHEVLEPKAATDEDILLVHTKEYLNRLKRLASQNGSLAVDTPVTPGILEAAYYSVGGSILALTLALEGKRVMNLLGGMHHAGIGDSSGFCIFNDQAIAIRKLQKAGKVKRALIYDIDVHAGQGTQEIFYSDPDVFTFSLHQDPATLYPGTGFPWQTGAEGGQGYNLNIVLEPGIGEGEYLAKLDSALEKTKDFPCDVVVLVFGVDTFREDMLANINLNVETYRAIGERFRRFKKLAVLCAGGYSREVPNLWLEFLKGLLHTSEV